MYGRIPKAIVIEKNSAKKNRRFGFLGPPNAETPESDSNRPKASQTCASSRAAVTVQVLYLLMTDMSQQLQYSSASQTNKQSRAAVTVQLMLWCNKCNMVVPLYRWIPCVSRASSRVTQELSASRGQLWRAKRFFFNFCEFF